MRRHGEVLNRIVVETCRADKRKNSRDRSGNETKGHGVDVQGVGIEQMRSA